MHFGSKKMDKKTFFEENWFESFSFFALYTKKRDKMSNQTWAGKQWFAKLQ